ncbi:MAG: TonB-dependent receptor, partial [Spirochaetes bacterium]|nr:TonB-dependent receptor [Spirochaetota bacterium]
MELKKISQAFFIALLLVAFKSIAHAQTGTVTGRVIDAVTGEPIIGVNVIIRQHNIVGVTNIDGRFMLQNVPEGEQRVEFRMMGYSPSFTTVNVVAGRSNVVNVTMSYLTVHETVVKAKKISSTDAALLSIRKKAPVAQDAISAEQISKSPDADAGDAAKRVTGITVVDGKHGKMVYIRGLGERYASVMFAGTILSSPDPDKRVVPLDIFPAALLDNLIITKSYIPEMPGEYGGGQVQVNPKDYTEEYEFKVSVGSGYHTTTTRKDFLTYRGGKYDFFGYDDGTRALPSGIGREYLNYLNYTPAQTEAIGESLTNEYTPDYEKGKFPFDVNFSYNDSWRVGAYNIGMVVSGLFREKSTTREIRTMRVSDDFQILKLYDVLKSTYATS